MAFSAVFSPSYTPQTSLLSPPKPHSLSPTTSSFPPQPTNKFLVQPLKYTRISPIGVNPKRSVGKVTASMKWEKSYNNVEVFAKDHLAVSLAYDVAELSSRYTKERGTFTVVLSGGSVIKYLRKLVEPPYKDTIEWSKWHVFWVEERVVAKDHLESNHKLAHDGFLSKVPIPPENIHAIDDTQQADKAAEIYEANIRELVNSNVVPSANGFPKFDLMLLSMGPEGQVGSLFPGHPVLKEDKKWVSFMRDAPRAPAERIGFTFPVINSSSNIAMVVTGAGKATAIYSALEDDQKTEKLPVELVSPAEGELKWYLDKGAASKLFKE